MAPLGLAPFTFVLDDLLYLPLAPADFFDDTSSALFLEDKLFILAAGRQVFVVPPPFVF